MIQGKGRVQFANNNDKCMGQLTCDDDKAWYRLLVMMAIDDVDDTVQGYELLVLMLENREL